MVGSVSREDNKFGFTNYLWQIKAQQMAHADSISMWYLGTSFAQSGILMSRIRNRF